MPRLDKLVFDERDLILGRIIAAFESVRDVKDLYGDKQKFALDLEKDGIDLNYITKAFKVYAAGKEKVKIDKAYCEKIYNYLKRSAGIVNDAQLLSDFKNHYSELHARAIDKISPFEMILGDRIKIPFLEDTKWLVYSRLGKRITPKQKQWGIAVGHIAFSAKPQFTWVDFDYMFDGNRRTFKGTANLDINKAHLYLDLISDDTGKRLSMVFRISQANEKEQKIMIGQYTFFSEEYDHILSKIAVIQKLIKGVDSETLYGNYMSGPSEDKKLLNIPSNIRKFLYPRERNRMSFPNDVITKPKQLDDFLNDHRKVNSILKEVVCGTYKVFFMPGNKLIYDDLKITYNEDASQIDCAYEHYTHAEMTGKRSFMGIAVSNTQGRVITLKLGAEDADAPAGIDSPIQIMFYIPGNLDSAMTSSCFIGLVNGVYDDGKRPVAYVVLLVKDDVILDEDKRAEINRFLVETPINKEVSREERIALNNSLANKTP